MKSKELKEPFAAGSLLICFLHVLTPSHFGELSCSKMENFFVL